jgi:8-oxo-dGTP diphosphatase
MNPIEVICGIIIQDSKVLVAQRGFNMTLPYKWEFPGGKKQNHETDIECLERELLEELNIRVIVKQQFASNIHSYGTFNILLIAYLAELVEGTILTFEHTRVEWYLKHELSTLDWAAADIPIVKELIGSSYL